MEPKLFVNKDGYAVGDTITDYAKSLYGDRFVSLLVSEGWVTVIYLNDHGDEDEAMFTFEEVVVDA